jgi:hypothetical protein
MLLLSKLKLTCYSLNSVAMDIGSFPIQKMSQSVAFKF